MQITLKQHSVVSFRCPQGKLVKGDNLSTSLQNPCTCPLSHMKCTNLQDKGESIHYITLIRRTLKKTTHSQSYQRNSCCLLDLTLEWLLHVQGPKNLSYLQTTLPICSILPNPNKFSSLSLTWQVVQQKVGFGYYFLSNIIYQHL